MEEERGEGEGRCMRNPGARHCDTYGSWYLLIHSMCCGVNLYDRENHAWVNTCSGACAQIHPPWSSPQSSCLGSSGWGSWVKGDSSRSFCSCRGISGGEGGAWMGDKGWSSVVVTKNEVVIFLGVLIMALLHKPGTKPCEDTRDEVCHQSFPTYHDKNNDCHHDTATPKTKFYLSLHLHMLH